MKYIEDARECVQEAFLTAFKNLDRFEERSSLWTWIDLHDAR